MQDSDACGRMLLLAIGSRLVCSRRLAGNLEICRMQVADGLEFELPSDVEDDEEIDEDMAFTEEDKIQFAGMFGDASDSGEEAEEDANLLDSGASDQEEGYNTDVS